MGRYSKHYVLEDREGNYPTRLDHMILTSLVLDMGASTNRFSPSQRAFYDSYSSDKTIPWRKRLLGLWSLWGVLKRGDYVYRHYKLKELTVYRGVKNDEFRRLASAFRKNGKKKKKGPLIRGMIPVDIETAPRFNPLRRRPPLPIDINEVQTDELVPTPRALRDYLTERLTPTGQL